MTDLTQSNNGLVNIWPEVIAEQCNHDTVEFNLFVSESVDYFAGHFPGTPILAGVVQLHWAVEYAKKAFNLEDCGVANIEVLKFQAIIVPNQQLFLTLSRKTNKKIIFTYHSERGQHASGRIVFGSND